MREQGAPGELSSNCMAGSDCIPADSELTAVKCDTFKAAAEGDDLDNTVIAFETKENTRNASFSSVRGLDTL